MAKKRHKYFDGDQAIVIADSNGHMVPAGSIITIKYVDKERYYSSYEYRRSFVTEDLMPFQMRELTAEERENIQPVAVQCRMRDNNESYTK